MIFFSLIVVIVAQVIYSQIVINGASSFHTNAVQVIEESGFDSNVIEQCIEEAESKGYKLDVIYSKEEVLKCSACNSTWTVDEATNCPNCASANVYTEQKSSDGVVTLTYMVNVDMLGIEKEGSLQSNAR